MERRILFCILAIYSLSLFAYDIRVANNQGIELCYNILEDGISVEFTRDRIANYLDSTYKYITEDTLYIPEIIEYNTQLYTVISIDKKAFSNMTPTVEVVVLPRTIQNIFYEGVGSQQMAGLCSFVENRLKKIEVESENPYFTTKEGILYTSDMQTLIAYPTKNPRDSVFIDEGVTYIAPTAFESANYITFLDLPLSLRKIGSFSLCDMLQLRQLVVKDNVDTLLAYSISSPGLLHLTLGSGIRYVANHFFESDSSVQLYCHAIVPPAVKNPQSFLTYDESSLYVPRQSLSAYQQAEGWKEFGTILPIEPPIVAGVDTAEVSWVQNFSATGYVWTLYLDEAKTQRFMSLTFDASGHLTHIDINSGHLPTRMPALYNEGVEGEKRFAEYYSFTISGLSPETRYYYTRQSMKGMEVIDEENGSFETLSSKTEGLERGNGISSEPQKIIKDGSVCILHQEKKYSLDGNCINQ